jgi:hypothetical protein
MYPFMSLCIYACISWASREGACVRRGEQARQSPQAMCVRHPIIQTCAYIVSMYISPYTHNMHPCTHNSMHGHSAHTCAQTCQGVSRCSIPSVERPPFWSHERISFDTKACNSWRSSGKASQTHDACFMRHICMYVCMYVCMCI